MSPSVSDIARGEDSVSIQVFQSAGLIDHVRTLRKLALNSTSDNEIVCLSTAGILMAAAAVEALLSESASMLDPKLYKERRFIYAGAPDKYEMLVEVRSKGVDELWDKRIAIQHSEPDNERSRTVGLVLNPEGIVWALEVVCAVAREAWAHHQKQMPDYLEQAVRGA